MAAATVNEAVAHPNWSMGAKISVDSATMMNKGLEMIEASYLFAMEEGKIDVVVHPQSVVHSLVEYQDGSTLAQLGPPDMKAPIACALSWPRRISWPAEPMDLPKWGSLTFEAPDLDRFPALVSGAGGDEGGFGCASRVQCGQRGGGGGLPGRSKIGFLDIANVVSETLGSMNFGADFAVEGDAALEAAMSVDCSARTVAEGALKRAVSVH